MNCGDPNCANPDNHHLVLAPTITSDGDGAPDPLFLCLPCVHRLGLWCDKHQLVHTGFQSGGHACLPCIEDAVAQQRDQASTWADRLRAALSEDDWEEIQDWADMTGCIMGDPDIDTTVLRALMTAAHRQGRNVDQIVEDVCSAGSVKDLLPPVL